MNTPRPEPVSAAAKQVSRPVHEAAVTIDAADARLVPTQDLPASRETNASPGVRYQASPLVARHNLVEQVSASNCQLDSAYWAGPRVMLALDHDRPPSAVQ